MYSKINTHNLVISRINSLQEIYESIRAMITGMPRRLKAPISAKCRQNYPNNMRISHINNYTHSSIVVRENVF